MTSAELLNRLSDCFDNNGELYKPTEAEALLRDYARAVLAEAERALWELEQDDVWSTDRKIGFSMAADLLAGMRRP